MSQSSSSTSSRAPRQLPGYYWDEEQQKYFPLVSRPLGAAITKRVTPVSLATCLSPNASSKYHHASSETHLESTQEIPQKTDTWKRDEMQLRQWMMSELRTKPYDYGRANSMQHEILGHDITSYCRLRTKNLLYSSAVRSWSFTPSISCFKLSAQGQQRHLIVGNADGTLWWLNQPSGEHDSSPRERHDPQHEALNEDGWRLYEPPYYNAEQARSNASMVMMKDLVYKICVSEEICIATSFGSSLNLAVLSLGVDSDTQEPRGLVIPVYHFPRISDVFSSALYKKSAVLGARKQVIHIPNVDHASDLAHRRMHTKSDVLSLYHQNSDVLAGLRNGSILRFDTRTSQPGQELFDGYFRQKTASSVTWMEAVKENPQEIVVATMAGDLEMFDLRYPKKGRPIMRFEGHVNSIYARLGIAMDPSSNFLFAAGGDDRIRAWSLRTGELLESTSCKSMSVASTTDTITKFSDLVFDEPCRCIEVTEGARGQGLRLWVARKDDIEGYGLGRMEPVVPTL